MIKDLFAPFLLGADIIYRGCKALSCNYNGIYLATNFYTAIVSCYVRFRRGSEVVEVLVASAA